MSKQTGPQFLRFFIPLIEAIRELGGSANSAEATDLVIEKLGISEEEQQETLKNGASRVRNQIAWARLYLVKAGFLDSSQRAIWSLTEDGLRVDTVSVDVLGYFKIIHEGFVQKGVTARYGKQQKTAGTDIEDFTCSDHKSDLLGILRTLPPEGFERLCQRLLRESGFQQVTVTGRGTDGGIDGHGVLRVNPFVSFTVMFQCKRYKKGKTVGAPTVRDFRGAVMGRADKGIILTTGSFTVDAKKEARRDGAVPIELVDGDSLIEMFERLELGVTPATAYIVDEEFFKEFQ